MTALDVIREVVRVGLTAVVAVLLAAFLRAVPL